MTDCKSLTKASFVRSSSLMDCAARFASAEAQHLNCKAYSKMGVASGRSSRTAGGQVLQSFIDSRTAGAQVPFEKGTWPRRAAGLYLIPGSGSTLSFAACLGVTLNIRDSIAWQSLPGKRWWVPVNFGLQSALSRSGLR